LLRLKFTNGQLEGPAAKFLGPDAASKLGATDGDLIVFVAAPPHVANPALDRVRQEVAKRLELIKEGAHEFLIVTEFPLFEKDPDSGALMAVHHPFTSPMAEDIPLLDTAPEKVRANAYDVVYNGTELGGGSIRISDPSLQARMFKLLGIDDATAEARFGFLLEGLRAGAPPHGGVAFGLDRISMQLAGAQSLRDVIAFPKTTAARALYEGAPTQVPAEDLKELHIKVKDGL
jgi:aspartyl-tRNA synthetase